MIDLLSHPVESDEVSTSSESDTAAEKKDPTWKGSPAAAVKKEKATTAKAVKKSPPQKVLHKYFTSTPKGKPPAGVQSAQPNRARAPQLDSQSNQRSRSADARGNAARSKPDSGIPPRSKSAGRRLGNVGKSREVSQRIRSKISSDIKKKKHKRGSAG